MVEGARLESVYTSKGYRGFESLSLRSNQVPRLGHFFWVFFDENGNCPSTIYLKLYVLNFFFAISSTAI